MEKYTHVQSKQDRMVTPVPTCLSHPTSTVTSVLPLYLISAFISSYPHVVLMLVLFKVYIHWKALVLALKF